MSNGLAPKNVCRREIRPTLRRFVFLLHLGTIAGMMHKWGRELCCWSLVMSRYYWKVQSPIQLVFPEPGTHWNSALVVGEICLTRHR
jgi:hypothetical protein